MLRFQHRWSGGGASVERVRLQRRGQCGGYHLCFGKMANSQGADGQPQRWTDGQQRPHQVAKCYVRLQPFLMFVMVTFLSLLLSPLNHFSLLPALAGGGHEGDGSPEGAAFGRPWPQRSASPGEAGGISASQLSALRQSDKYRRMIDDLDELRGDEEVFNPEAPPVLHQTMAMLGGSLVSPQGRQTFPSCAKVPWSCIDENCCRRTVRCPCCALPTTWHDLRNAQDRDLRCFDCKQDPEMKAVSPTKMEEYVRSALAFVTSLGVDVSAGFEDGTSVINIGFTSGDVPDCMVVRGVFGFKIPLSIHAWCSLQKDLSPDDLRIADMTYRRHADKTESYTTVTFLNSCSEDDAISFLAGVMAEHVWDSSNLERPRDARMSTIVRKGVAALRARQRWLSQLAACAEEKEPSDSQLKGLRRAACSYHRQLNLARSAIETARTMQVKEFDVLPRGLFDAIRPILFDTAVRPQNATQKGDEDMVDGLVVYTPEAGDMVDGAMKVNTAGPQGSDRWDGRAAEAQTSRDGEKPITPGATASSKSTQKEVVDAELQASRKRNEKAAEKKKKAGGVSKVGMGLYLAMMVIFCVGGVALFLLLRKKWLGTEGWNDTKVLQDAAADKGFAVSDSLLPPMS